MLSKRKVPHWDVSNKKKFRYNLADVFLSNTMSGSRAQSLFSDAAAAGASHVDDLSRAGAHGKHPGNCHRDLLRKLSKGSHWPSLYYAKVRVTDRKAGGREKIILMPMLLPHEVVGALCEKGDVARICLVGVNLLV